MEDFSFSVRTFTPPTVLVVRESSFIGNEIRRIRDKARAGAKLEICQLKDLGEIGEP